eukprot:XP_001705651.1 Hypothetical protein GL50803_38019 [Giardia lamblia ATCC 50803]
MLPFGTIQNYLALLKWPDSTVLRHRHVNSFPVHKVKLLCFEFCN